MKPALYTIFDCRAESAPFAARNLQEVLHFWGQAAREVVSLCGGGDTVEWALVLVRAQRAEEVLPWGRHPRADVLRALQRLQEHLAPSGDADLEQRRAVLEVCTEGARLALQGAAVALGQRRPGEPQRHLEVWTCDPPGTMGTLVGACEVALDHLRAAGVRITVVAASAERPRCELHAGHHIEVAVVSPTWPGILRHMRRHLRIELLANLHIPASDQLMDWPERRGPPCLRVASCRCACATLLPPRGAPPRSVVDFRFSCAVPSSTEAFHTYGLPMVLQGHAANGSFDDDGFKPFTRALRRRGLAAVFTVKVCPLEIQLGLRSHLVVAIPHSSGSALVVRGLLCYGSPTPCLSFAAEPAGMEVGGGADVEAEPAAVEGKLAAGALAGVSLGYSSWRFQGIYNPLKHAGHPSYSAAAVEALLASHAAAAPLLAPPPAARGGRGRGRGRGRTAAVAQVTAAHQGTDSGRLCAQVPVVPAAPANIGDGLLEDLMNCSRPRAAPPPAPPAAAPPGKPSSLEAAGVKGSMHLGPLTAGDVQSIASGTFEFTF